MNCPHCSAALVLDVNECPLCGFSVLAIRSLLGSEWVRLERLTDNANCLSLKEARHLEVVLDDFERNFPQCFFAVYLGTLPGMINARDLGFWLINHGAFHTQQMAKRNDFGCALVIDPSRQMVGLTLGYALESLVSDAEVKQILSQIGIFLRDRQFSRAIEHSVSLLAKRLTRQAKPVGPDSLQNPWGPADLGGMGLQTLRAAHRPLRSVSKE